MSVVKIKLVLLLGVFSLLSISVTAMEIPNVPKVPAFLPTVDQVSARQAMPIDGTWLVPAIGKKIRIDGGRAYAVDGWVHLFVLDIQPGMVVLKDLTPTGPGQYAGEDLPLMGKLTARVMADRSITVNVAGMLGAVSYKLVPVQINNSDWYQQEMQAAGLVTQGFNSYQQSYQISAPPGSMGQQMRSQQGVQSQQKQGYQYNYNQQANQNYSNQQQANQFQDNQNQPSKPLNQYNKQAARTPVSANDVVLEGNSECEEEVYDPETDTISCYKEGENQ